MRPATSVNRSKTPCPFSLWLPGSGSWMSSSHGRAPCLFGLLPPLDLSPRSGYPNRMDRPPVPSPPPHGAPRPPLPHGALPDHRPPRTPAVGCAKALAVVCGGLLVVALTAVTVLYFNMGPVVSWLQKEFVRKVLDGTRADSGVRKEVDEVFREYEEIRKKEHLNFNQWRAVSRAFGQRPVVLLLGILDTRTRLASLPSLSDEEKAILRSRSSTTSNAAWRQKRPAPQGLRPGWALYPIQG